MNKYPKPEHISKTKLIPGDPTRQTKRAAQRAKEKLRVQAQRGYERQMREEDLKRVKQAKAEAMAKTREALGMEMAV